MQNALAPIPSSLIAAPFRLQEVQEAGASRAALRRWLQEGQVRRVLRGVYRSVRLEDSILTRCTAASLVVPEHAIVVDRTAAWLWGIGAYHLTELAQVPPLELFVLRGNKRVIRAEGGGGERDLAPEDVTVLHGVRLTTPLRTSLDLACSLSPYEAMAAMDAFARLHGVGREQLAALLPRYRRRRGVVQSRRLVPLVDGRAESSGESMTKVAIVAYGLPVPEPQFWVVHDGRALFRLDLAYPSRKIAIEYDGQEHHTSEVDRERDRGRRRWLRDHGWIVIVVTKDSFAGAALEEWLHDVRAALDLRRAA
jgi:hypothetical protein